MTKSKDNSAATQDALKPCPFCGGAVEIKRDHTTEGTDYIRHLGDPCAVEFSNFGFDEPVDDLWNRRTIPTSGPEWDAAVERAAAASIAIDIESGLAGVAFNETDTENMRRICRAFLGITE